jgi:hypothetical protein
MTQSKFKGRLGGIFFLMNPKGISALFLVIAMLLMITIGYVFSYLIPTKQRSVVFPIQSTQAFFIAQSGAEFAVRYAKDQVPPWTTPSLLNGLDNMTRNLGSGKFTLDYDSVNDKLTSTGEVSNAGKRTIVVSSFTSFLAFFTYRKSITVNSDQVSSGPHSDFPMLVSLTDANLATVANGGHIASYNAGTNDPWDLVFEALDDTTCGGAGTSPCRLSHQIETYNSSTGQLIAWVKVPKMYYNSSSDRTVIYMYYGNSCMTASTQNASAVWDNNYVGVWHLQEDHSGTGTADLYTDSKNSNHGDDYVSATGKTGQIASGQQFDGTDDYVGMGNVLDYGQNDPVTYSAWVKTSGSVSQIAGKGRHDGSWQGVWFFIETLSTPGRLSFYLYDQNGNVKTKRSVETFSNNQWHYVVATYTGNNNVSGMTLYGDGSQLSIQDTINENLATVKNSYPFNIGAANNGRGYRFNGYIDEVRLSNSVRTAGWIATEHKNQSAPSSFYTVGGEEN